MLSNAAQRLGRRGRWRPSLLRMRTPSTSRTASAVGSSSCWTDRRGGGAADEGVLVLRMGSAAAARRSLSRGFSSHHRGPPVVSEEQGHKKDPDDVLDLLGSDGLPLQQRSKNEASQDEATFRSSTSTSTSHRIKTYTSQQQQQLILPSISGLDEWRQKQELDRAEQQQQNDGDTMLQYPVHELYRPEMHLPSAPTDWTGYEAATPLSDEVCALIGVTGRPVSVADYMRMALQHPAHGYYTRAQSSSSSTSGDDFDEEDDEDVVLEKNNDGTATTAPTTTKKDSSIIGGDFVTAPEVSHVFGECLGVWFGIQAAQNNFSEWQFLECGPGNGTLMVDLLRFTRSLSRAARQQQQPTQQHNFGDGCRRVHFVETSPALRQQQRDALVDNFRHDFHLVFDDDGDGTKNAAPSTTPVRSGAGRQPEYKKKPRLSVHWHSSLEDFRLWQQRTLQPDQLLPTFAVAQEFVDALPVYAFEKTKEGYWRERLVDVALRDDVAQELLEEEEEEQKERNNAKAKMEEKREEVPPLSSAAAIDATTPKSAMDLKQKKPRLRIVLAPEVTPPLRTLLQTDAEGRLPYDDPAPPGSIVEVCPEGILFAQDLATLVSTQGGAALVIDYGSARGSRDSLRGFSRHRQVHFLSRPGQVDITADVDFRALQHAVNVVQQQKQSKLPASPPAAAAAVENAKFSDSNSSTSSSTDRDSGGLQTAHAHGPVTQGAFLMAMGLQERIVNLMERDEVTYEQAEDFYQAMVRLVSPEQMGELYKVLAITTAARDDGAAAADPPPGFENATTL